MNAGIKAGRILQGHFVANQYNYLEAGLDGSWDDRY